MLAAVVVPAVSHLSSGEIALFRPRRVAPMCTIATAPPCPPPAAAAPWEPTESGWDNTRNSSSARSASSTALHVGSIQYDETSKNILAISMPSCECIVLVDAGRWSISRRSTWEEDLRFFWWSDDDDDLPQVYWRSSRARSRWLYEATQQKNKNKLTTLMPMISSSLKSWLKIYLMMVMVYGDAGSLFAIQAEQG